MVASAHSPTMRQSAQTLQVVRARCPAPSRRETIALIRSVILALAKSRLMRLGTLFPFPRPVSCHSPSRRIPTRRRCRHRAPLPTLGAVCFGRL